MSAYISERGHMLGLLVVQSKLMKVLTFWLNMPTNEPGRAIGDTIYICLVGKCRCPSETTIRKLKKNRVHNNKQPGEYSQTASSLGKKKKKKKFPQKRNPRLLIFQPRVRWSNWAEMDSAGDIKSMGYLQCVSLPGGWASWLLSQVRNLSVMTGLQETDRPAPLRTSLKSLREVGIQQHLESDSTNRFRACGREFGAGERSDGVSQLQGPTECGGRVRATSQWGSLLTTESMLIHTLASFTLRRIIPSCSSFILSSFVAAGPQHVPRTSPPQAIYGEKCIFNQWNTPSGCSTGLLS